MTNMASFGFRSAVAGSCLFLTSCALQGGHVETSRCQTSSLSSVIADPVSFQNKVYCGEAFIRRGERTIWILQSPDEEPSYDVSLLVAVDGRSRLGQIDETPSHFLIRARIDPQVECFATRTDPLDEEGCVPFRRPVYFHIISARRTSR